VHRAPERPDPSARRACVPAPIARRHLRPSPRRKILLLCGSMISHMEELLAERNPLYGRKTLALDLAPLSFRDASQFVARSKAEDKLVTAGVFGGLPFYLQLLDQGATL
jgi:hypothetical protein